MRAVPVARLIFGVGLAVAACAEPARVRAPAARSQSGADSDGALQHARARPYGSPIAPRAAEVACTAQLSQNRAVAAALPQGSEKSLRAFVSACVPTPIGAWVARARANALPVVVHIDAFGKGVERGLPTGPNDANCSEGEATLSLKPVADYDGDGESEIYVGVSRTGPHQTQCQAHEILSFHDGAIEPLSIPGRMVGITDFDRDGLDDPLVEYFVSEFSDCSGYAHRVSGPPLLAHALTDGTFSLNDAAARRFSRDRCPSPPPPEQRAANVACARLWGATAREVLDAVGRTEAECRVTMGHQANADPCATGTDACARDREEGFAHAQLPLNLAR